MHRRRGKRDGGEEALRNSTGNRTKEEEEAGEESSKGPETGGNR